LMERRMYNEGTDRVRATVAELRGYAIGENFAKRRA